MMTRSIATLVFGMSLLWASIGLADSVFATRTLRANSVLTAGDLEIRTSARNGTESSAADLSLLIGFELRDTVFKGQRITRNDVAPRALVERNQPVLLVFSSRGLAIETDGRALDRGRAGDAIRVMNLGSRTTVTGIVDAYGAVQVGKVEQ